MSLSEHDRAAIEAVAAFCHAAPLRKSLQWVWLSDGWVAGCDSYRLDAREVDTDHVGPVNPYTMEGVETKPLDWWSVVGLGPHGCEVASRSLTLDRMGPKPGAGSREVLCLGCLAWEKIDTGAMSCACEAPLVNRRFLWDAIAGADEPEVRLRWRTRDLMKPLRYDEPEHFHLLMPIRRRVRL